MKVAKWGNSLAIRLPAAVVEALNLKEGDELNITAHDPNNGKPQGAIIMRKPTDEEFLERLRALRQRLPADLTFSREEANER